MLREWLPLLARKLTPKDKARIEANKADAEQAMVVKRVNKNGKVTVYLNFNLYVVLIYFPFFIKVNHGRSVPNYVL